MANCEAVVGHGGQYDVAVRLFRATENVHSKGVETVETVETFHLIEVILYYEYVYYSY